MATLTYLLPGAEDGGGDVARRLSPAGNVECVWGTGDTKDKEGKFLGL